jgi:hypothetical protein
VGVIVRPSGSLRPALINLSILPLSTCYQQLVHRRCVVLVGYTKQHDGGHLVVGCCGGPLRMRVRLQHEPAVWEQLHGADDLMVFASSGDTNETVTVRTIDLAGRGITSIASGGLDCFWRNGEQISRICLQMPEACHYCRSSYQYYRLRTCHVGRDSLTEGSRYFNDSQLPGTVSYRVAGTTSSLMKMYCPRRSSAQQHASLLNTLPTVSRVGQPLTMSCIIVRLRPCTSTVLFP